MWEELSGRTCGLVAETWVWPNSGSRPSFASCLVLAEFRRPLSGSQLSVTSVKGSEGTSMSVKRDVAAPPRQCNP